MYKKKTEGWFKHYDFILLDMFCLQMAFWLAYVLRNPGMSPYSSILYRNAALFIEMADIIVLFSMGILKGIVRRGHYKEFIAIIQQTSILGGLTLTYLYFFQKSEEYSRIVFGLTVLFYMFFNYVGNMVNPLLAEEVRYLKETEGGRSQMCRLLEEMRNEAAAKAAAEAAVKGKAEGKISTALNMLARGRDSIEEIAELTELPLEEVQKLADK